ncbi:hypothetical protein ABPG77_007186 [Micractinium sp. CCAP 211/92]
MPVLRPGEVVQSERGEGLWQVERKIGEGQFSEVYSVVEQNTQQQRAVKIEKRIDVRTVRQEYKVLKRLQAGCRQAVRVHEGGEYAGGRFYMVMDLLGPNLSTVRRGALGGALEPTAAKVVAASMLKALEQVHAEGFIHRDVKPANFVMDPADATDPASAAWTLVDFGLARQYIDEASRQPLPPRPEAAFRGSTTYASVNCHRLEDQSRRDDLWGWFYCLVELIEGTLPWRSDREAAVPAATNTTTLGGGGADSQLPSPPQDLSQATHGGAQQQQAGGAGGGALGLPKEQVLQRKLECLEQPQLLVRSIPCPQAIVDLSNYLRGLGFEDAPNHLYLRSLLGKLDGPAAAPQGLPQPADEEVQQQQQQQQQGAAPLAGREQRADQREEQMQQGQGPAAPLSKQRSRDRSRERRGRGRRSRSSSRSRSRDRDRDRDRGRRRQEHSRERRRSKSRDRDSRRSRSRSRPRARERERGKERERARRRSSRSRSADRYTRRNDAAAAPARRRTRSRSPYGGSSRAQLRRGSGSNAKNVDAGLSVDAKAALAVQEAGLSPAEGGGSRAAAQQAPASAAAAGHAEPAAVPQQYTTDMHAKYRAGLELVFALRQGALSEAGAAACRQLRSLEPAEAAGVVCWLLDELATGAEQRHLPAVGAFCEEVAAFALGTAKRCSERSRKQ